MAKTLILSMPLKLKANYKNVNKVVKPNTIFELTSYINRRDNIDIN